MGLCVSQVALSEEEQLGGVGNRVGSEVPDKPVVENGEVLSEETMKMLESAHEPQKMKLGGVIRPGYASGASSDVSFGSSSCGDFGVSREESVGDKLNLQTMRSELAKEETLSNLAVRLESPFGKPIEEFYDGVADGPVLGSGVSGLVRLVTHRKTGVKYAVKCLDIGLIQTEAGLRQLRNEISIMCQLDHPNIVELEEVYESTNEIYLVQELCVGGDLFDRLDEQSDYHYSEAQCARLVKQMLSSVRYLHSKSIIHRDLKLENFLFTNTSADSELKMIDFGLSKHFFNGQVHHEKVGTPYTVAPEIIRGSYDEKSDIWAMGVITYLLLSGETPFGGCEGEDLLLVKDNILRGSFLFEPEDIWENVSDLGKNFVKRLLNRDQSKRPTAREAQQDPWLQIWAKKDVKEVDKLNTNTIKSLVRFKEYSDMQKLLYEILSFTLLPEQIAELRDEFEKMDTNGDGEISLSSLKQVLMDNALAGSLGALTEEEVEDIFNSLRLRKNEISIRWHEFIAAGLSQCKVDERNLKLAFDRLDTDGKGFIEFEDMMYLFPTSTEEESFRRMWQESVEDCKGNLGRITYEKFIILMKGQASNPPSQSPSALRRQASQTGNIYRLSSHTDASLGPVVEVPQEGTSTGSDENASITVSVGEDEEAKNKEDIQLKKFLEKNNNNGKAKKSRSHSAGSRELDSVERRASFLALTLSGRADDKIDKVINDETKTPLVVNRALYRKHREMRIAVCEASKQFDAMCQRRRAGEEKVKEVGSPLHGAGLIMRRGFDTPANLEDTHQRAMFEAAARRSGRPMKRNRRKTASDITGMMAAAGGMD